MITIKFIDEIDWKLFNKQKQFLVNILDNKVYPEHLDYFEGILHLMDQLQDFAVDDLQYPEEVIFDDGEIPEEDHSEA